MLNSLSIGTANAYAQEMIDYTLPQCEGINETVLRVELNKIIQEFLSNETELDFGKTINQQWRALNIDYVFNSEVDNAVDVVSNDAGLVNRLKSSWLPSKAEELTNEVTQIAFNSPVLNSKLDQLSENVADELVGRLELISVKSSSYAMDCLQRFINRQYSETFVDIFGKKIETSLPNSNNILASLDLQPDTKDFLVMHKFAFGGVASFAVAAGIRRLITKKIIERVTQQIISRIAGRLGATAIPIVGEFVGAILLGTDVIKSFDGALPAIQENLKAPEVKQTFRQEIAQKVEAEFRSESYQISREISNDVYAQWLDFQKDYRDALSLANELPEFKEILVQTNNLSKISSLVGISLNNMGRSQLVASIQDGSFERALSLPEVTYKMLETTHSLPILVEWTNLAGNQVEDVVRLEIYKHQSPQALDHKLLMEMLALKDDELIAKLSLLDVNSIRKLLMISKQNLLAISVDLSAEALNRLAGYLEELQQFEVNELVRFLLNDDTSLVKNNRIIEYIIQSRNIKTAIEFWDAEASPLSIINGVLKMSIGAISWRLFASKYGILLFALLIAVPVILLLAILLWFYQQLLKIRQAQKTLQTNSKPES